MRQQEEPNADPIMLATLLGMVGFMMCFAYGFYCMMQPTIVPNVGLAGYETQVRRSNELFTATLTRESERAAAEVAKQENETYRLEMLAENEQGREKLAKQATQRELSAFPLPKRIVEQAPKRVVRELYANQSSSPRFNSPFNAFSR